MSLNRRNLEESLLRDWEKKFVLLSGPRQVGKTTLAKKLVASKGGAYLLYDDDDDRRTILKKEYAGSSWVCLDEFHKFPRWKSHIKAAYDKYHERLHLLLTGSARLDIYQKSGDSLLGRYYLHHLHPFTAGELHSAQAPEMPVNVLQPHSKIRSIAELLKFGGFPEPFSSQSETEHRRWSNARARLLIREDLREITQVELVALAEQLMMLLPERIGSLFSFRSLAEDIRVSPPTIQNWMSIFERLFIVFKVTPYSQKVIRSIRKQPKYYFYDWSQATEEGGRFENLVAGHLWKAVQFWTDLGHANLTLHHVRDRNGREVDFLIVKDRKPWFLVEAKVADTQISESLRYFSQRFQVPGIQMVLKENVWRREGSLAVVSADQWLGHLP